MRRQARWKKDSYILVYFQGKQFCSPLINAKFRDKGCKRSSGSIALFVSDSGEFFGFWQAFFDKKQCGEV
jgi:hypothetical protein